ncbi:hypothetical protein [Serratia sp. (in: enterobacteria)]|uniref:hypothetical protein n=1 Tax=Serratia sp. (in: enterobacteria) TaxID=616 RepID=UPI00398A391D
MARRKIWSYAYKGNKEYVWSDKVDKERLFFIWEAIKIRKENPQEFSTLTFMSTQFNKNKRSELIPVKKSKTAFFRYKSESMPSSESQDSDSELISHETAILVLSEMSVVKFQEGNTLYEIEFDKIKKDDLKIRFENGATYYPDLMGFFSKPEELAKRWGGKVAIEVKVTHECSYEKIKDFEDHNIPIIEVRLSDKLRLRSEINNTDIDESDMERYYHLLHSKFSKVVYMKVLSNPVMLKEHNSILLEKNKEIFELNNKIIYCKNELENEISKNKVHNIKIEKLEKSISVFKENIPRLKKFIDDGKTEKDKTLKALHEEKDINKSLEKKILHLESTNYEYENLSFIQRLKRLF